MRITRREFVVSTAAVLAASALLGSAPLAFAQGPSNEELMRPGALPDLVLGKADAPVTIIEYASMTCPHCANFHKTTYPALKSKYIETGKVRFIFREFPLDDLAVAASMLARCAGAEKSMALIDDGVKAPRVTGKKPPLTVPQDMRAAIDAMPAAKACFDGFAPSCQREYVEWVTEAKRDETRAKRLAQTVEWLAEGKRRNWKYENC